MTPRTIVSTKKCRRHDWCDVPADPYVDGMEEGFTVCCHCGRARDESERRRVVKPHKETHRVNSDGHCLEWYEGHGVGYDKAQREAVEAYAARLREAVERLGMYPAATPSGPRTEWQTGWNAGADAVLDVIEREKP